jgi:hypothetical protein
LFGRVPAASAGAASAFGAALAFGSALAFSSALAFGSAFGFAALAGFAAGEAEAIADAEAAPTVTLLALGGVFPAALLEADHLGAAGLIDHLGLHGGAGDEWRADGDVALGADHQDFVELDRVAGFRRQLLDRELVVLGDLVLLAARFDDREHRGIVLFMSFASCGAASCGLSEDRLPRLERRAPQRALVKTKHAERTLSPRVRGLSSQIRRKSSLRWVAPMADPPRAMGTDTSFAPPLFTWSDQYPLRHK